MKVKISSSNSIYVENECFSVVKSVIRFIEKYNITKVRTSRPLFGGWKSLKYDKEAFMYIYGNERVYLCSTDLIEMFGKIPEKIYFK